MANNYPTSKYNDSRLIDFHLVTFEQLIEEHFNNTESFKHFKMYSDSTLKSMNKDELIELIHVLYHN